MKTIFDKLNIDIINNETNGKVHDENKIHDRCGCSTHKQIGKKFPCLPNI